MKPRLHSFTRLSFPLATAIVALLFAPSASAVDFWWDGGTANWSTASAWSTLATAATPDPTAAPAPSTTADLFFNRTGVITNNIISLAGGDRLARSLTFNSTGTSIFRANGSGTTNLCTLTVGAGGITLNSGAGAVTIGDTPATFGAINITLGASQVWTNNSSNTFTLAGAVGGGAVDLTKSGTTQIRLNGANTYTGATIVNEGNLSIGNDAGLSS